MLNIRRVFLKIIACPLNSHLRKDHNFYNNLVFLGGRLVFIPKLICMAPVIAEISVRFPSPREKIQNIAVYRLPLQKLEEERTFFHRMVGQYLGKYFKWF